MFDFLFKNFYLKKNCFLFLCLQNWLLLLFLVKKIKQWHRLLVLLMKLLFLILWTNFTNIISQFDGENSVGCSENNFLVEVKKILKESKNSDQKKVFFICHCFKNMEDFEYLYDFFRRKYKIFSAEKCHHYKNEIL